MSEFETIKVIKKMYGKEENGEYTYAWEPEEITFQGKLLVSSGISFDKAGHYIKMNLYLTPENKYVLVDYYVVGTYVREDCRFFDSLDEITPNYDFEFFKQLYVGTSGCWEEWEYERGYQKLVEDANKKGIPLKHWEYKF